MNESHSCNFSATAMEAPLRGELFSLEHLRSHATQLSEDLCVELQPKSSWPLTKRFSDNCTYLRDVYAEICKGLRGGDSSTPDAEWLLDNFYVVEEQLREIRDDLPPSYSRELPRLTDGVPRTYRLAEELLIHTDSVLDQDAIISFISQFQVAQPLTIGEVWAIPIMLRLALVENLRRLSAQLLHSRRCRCAVREKLIEWQPDQPLPEILRDRNSDPDLTIESLTIAYELFPEDPARFAALDQLLAETFPDAQHLLADVRRRQAANQVTIGNVITSMRLITALDWVAFFEQTSLVEAILREDPAGVYGQMDLASRDRYRHVLEGLAKHSTHSDRDIAHRVVQRAREAAGNPSLPEYCRHVGYWLVDEGRVALEQELDYCAPVRLWPRRFVLAHPALTYFGGLFALLLVGLSLLGWLLSASGVSMEATTWMLLLAVIPVSEVAISLVNWTITHLLPPRILPKLDDQQGIPATQRSILVVPAMLTSIAEAHALVRRLELHYVANSDPKLRFALLTDFPDSDAEHQPQDDAIISAARAGIRTLNQRYRQDEAGPFHLLHRARRWNESQGVWMGWERKRGKLVEFNRLLHGDELTSYVIHEGDAEELRGTPDRPAFEFVITLDSDTQLPLQTAGKLIATLAHPLNRACVDPHTRRVTHGYGLLQPRVSVRPSDGPSTHFTRLFANSRGFDPYSVAASDVSQDLFGEGSFTGKGIYDLKAFESTLTDAFPENQILSHDLIEGSHARVGLVSDIEVVDGYPSRYDADARRQHRWARGDWQILPWLFPRVPSAKGPRSNPLSALSRWKIFDNLRRSVLPPVMLVLLITGWFRQPELSWAWSLLGLICLGFPAIHRLLGILAQLPGVENWRAYYRNSTSDARQAIGQVAVVTACLPYSALLMADAIVRTLYRIGWSRRHLLEWETAAAAERRLANSRWSTWRQMGFIPIVAIVLAVTLPSAARLAALPWLALWLVAPLIADFISRPIRKPVRELSDDDRQWLRLVARNTWSYFEEFVSARTNFLPPDNFQEYPQEKLAERISPTNEGLFLVSGLVARDFGFIALHDLCELWEKNLAVWTRLPTLHGHFYNWYETSTLLPLRPRYISTVDSGNFAASLIVIERGVQDLYTRPVASEVLWHGVRDTVEVALQACGDLQPRGAHIVSPPLDNLTTALEVFRQQLTPRDDSTKTFANPLQGVRVAIETLLLRLEELTESHRHPTELVSKRVNSLIELLRGVEHDCERLLPWLAAEDQVMASLPSEVQDILTGDLSLQELTNLPARVMKIWTDIESRTEAGLSELHPQSLMWADSAAASARALQDRYLAVANLAEQLVRQMDFQFLYNPQRRLFSIGYNLEDERLDRSYYDMLCSEARLTSHLVIAKGEVPPKHWFQLGRQLTTSAGQTGLLSWGGTMFEFLMPVLFQKSYPESLLSQACETAVARQREYGHQVGIPWGVSESAFGALAVNSDYHYQSFGVPGLGLKRGLSEDFVVAPYATMLALGIDPIEATTNLRRLAKEGANGRWGFYESIDYTPSRVPAGQRSIPVRCYMAHHQGMSLTALGNVLLGGLTQQRFHAHPLVQATEMLLQEAMSTAMPVIQPHADESGDAATVTTDSHMVSRFLVGYDTPSPRTHLLSNGVYSVLLTNSGGGYSQWKTTAITRWRPDLTNDGGGQYVYLRDCLTNRVWSATYQPTCHKPDAYEVTYSIDKAEYRRRDGIWETRQEVTVSSGDPVEVRQVTATNFSSEDREIELISYAEVVLTTAAADLAHPVFQKLFVETEYVPETHALMARRRPRSTGERPLWAVHVVSYPTALTVAVDYETSRAQFLGRGRDTASPVALENHGKWDGTTGAVLDPILSLRCRFTVPGHSSVSIAFTTGVAETREEALRLADQFQESRGARRAFELAWAFGQVQLQHLHLTAARAQQFQQLASFLFYPQQAGRGSPIAIRKNRQSQSGLWRFGISGDRSILLLRVSESDQVDFVREMLKAREYWDAQGFVCDLVILNTHPGSYLDALQEQLQRLVAELPRKSSEERQTVFLLRGAQIAHEDHWLLESTAHVVLDARRGWSNLKHLVAGLPTDTATAGTTTPAARKRPVTRYRGPATTDGTKPDSQRAAEALEFWNGLGGFYDAGREYRMHLRPGIVTPAPWCNVIANPRFGCVVTESGGGYTWAGNSREFKLSTWCNDPVTDSPAERLYLRDEDSFDVWSPLRDSATTSRWVHHGQGYTRVLTTDRDLDHDILTSIAPDDPVKFVVVKLTNRATVARTISATYFVELVLGVNREQTQMHVVTELDPTTQAIFAHNAYHAEHHDQVVLVRALGQSPSATGDRLEFLGRHRGTKMPAALEQAHLSGRTGAGFDPCAAVQCRMTVQPGASTEMIFLLGCGANGAEAQQILHRYGAATAVQEAISATIDRWDSTLKAVQVHTPNRAFDLLMNRWLVYQTLSCRLWGRSAFYQSGGAYGFRDQLQDVMALVYTRPDLVREHLLRAAARQFEEGDVQHWWHPPLGQGTRTKFSDDLLFLPFAVAHYVRITGDSSVLDESVPYLTSHVLNQQEHERYECPQVSSQAGTLYDHCLRAIERGFHLGEHGLPLMGCGDWNDGMNLVGAEGRGESVWVGWFLLVLIDDFLPVLKERGDDEFAGRLQERAAALRTSLERSAWDGEWYLRAFFDDGTPLGSRLNDECQIDSLTQSWAVLANADDERTDRALESVFERLVFPSDRLVALFQPPFDQTTLEPGYIKGYVPGVRENGGQYTHAVLWLIQALAQKQQRNRAMRLFDLINPINCSQTTLLMNRYRVEPYVMAADVYSAATHRGRGGWTWYTGSSSWAYRVGLESILGVSLRQGVLQISPCVPRDWKSFEISIRSGRGVWFVNVELTDETVANEYDVSDQELPLTLTDDGAEHRVTVRIGRMAPGQSGQACELSLSPGRTMGSRQSRDS